MLPPIKPPRTGIEQPFLRDRPRFKDLCKDFEPIFRFNPSLCAEMERLEAEKPQNGAQERIVYDCMDYPSQRIEGDSTPYIDENDLVELPPDDNSQNDSRKQYPYGPSGMGGYNSKQGVKINRYYTKLKTYY